MIAAARPFLEKMAAEESFQLDFTDDTSQINPVTRVSIRYPWIDLNGEGLAGVLAEYEGAWLYKPNLGDGRLYLVETRAYAIQVGNGEAHVLPRS